MKNTANGPGHQLSDEHRAHLTGQAITGDRIAAAGIWSDGGDIVFPWRDGGLLTEQRRAWPPLPDEGEPGGPPKYRWEPGRPLHFWAHRPVEDLPPGAPVIIAEGTKQSLAVASWAPDGYAVYGMPGCDNGQVALELARLERFAGRDVFILLDADAGSNLGVYEGGEKLAEALDLEDAAPKFALSPGRGTDGIDDYLARVGEARRAGRIAKLLERAGPKPAARRPRPKPGQPVSAEPAVPAVPVPPPLAWCPDIPGEAVAHLRACRGLVGEDRTTRLVYLALISSVLDDPVNTAMKGLSSSGKSYTIESAASLLPPEAIFEMTAMSEHALIYLREPLAHRTLVLYEAVALREDREKTESNVTAYIVRSLLSEGRIRYPTVVKDPETGHLVTVVIEKAGPTNLVTSTTSVSLHAENETRMLSLPSDDSRAQTRAVLLSSTGERKRGECDHREWHDLRRWIAQHDTRVLIPYAACVAARIDPVAVRLRRDWNAVRSLIKAHALLHQATRPRDATGQVVATLDDYDAVRELAGELIADAIGAGVPDTVRETVDAVAAIAATAGSWATVRQVAGRLRMERSAASRRLAAAAEHGYLVNVQARRGAAAQYQRTDVTMPGTCAVLPDAAQLCTPHCTPWCASLTSANACDCGGGCAGVQRARRGSGVRSARPRPAARSRPPPRRVHTCTPHPFRRHFRRSRRPCRVCRYLCRPLHSRTHLHSPRRTAASCGRSTTTFPATADDMARRRGPVKKAASTPASGRQPRAWLPVRWDEERERRGAAPVRDVYRCPLRGCPFASADLRIVVQHVRAHRDAEDELTAADDRSLSLNRVSKSAVWPREPPPPPPDG